MIVEIEYHLRRYESNNRMISCVKTHTLMVCSMVLGKSKWILDVVFTCISFPSGTDKTVLQPYSFIQEYLYSKLCSNF